MNRSLVSSSGSRSARKRLSTPAFRRTPTAPASAANSSRIAWSSSRRGYQYAARNWNTSSASWLSTEHRGFGIRGQHEPGDAVALQEDHSHTRETSHGLHLDLSGLGHAFEPEAGRTTPASGEHKARV